VPRAAPDDEGVLDMEGTSVRAGSGKGRFHERNETGDGSRAFRENAGSRDGPKHRGCEAFCVPKGFGTSWKSTSSVDNHASAPLWAPVMETAVVIHYNECNSESLFLPH
jgi:hypothetical protein